MNEQWENGLRRDATRHGASTRRRLMVALIAALVALAAEPAGAAPSEPVPTTMAGLGDSITRAYNACGFYVDCPSRSWSTGTSSAVTSHFQRLRDIDPAMSTNHNLARSGAKVAALPGQAQSAVERQAGYITILIGPNDACTSTEEGMTSVSDFRASVESAFAEFAGAPTVPRVFVSSIPDLKRLWTVGKDSYAARAAWWVARICQSMLARPLSTADADVARRDRVQQRVIDFNAVLAATCDRHAFCRHDNGAVFDYRFDLSHVSRWDYFHPSPNGQNVLAELTWEHGFKWRKGR